ncbi:ATP-dependent RNA helicase RhlE [Altererythrobacter atlanticus]|uniref:DEAD-box ATP-dependent RNA helicase RhpA n=1 Tax=Croceibacterium atlanticum TaxID=1267766 RepID=A0A0F7KRN8_9SPHN|nr:DEAD/DEAH box helicase [Croceibacterium atlanticum]AKH41786.1 ATP-dependent RNA helicase RhlE [Croceibacterium atlanticum]MBB5733251.1 ATP-dependent RNA helicase RhlE [Croceibacterium atlanticum]
MTFEQLGLSQPVLQALSLKGYETPSPIQEQAIPHVLEGKDLLGIAQTGTGKTAAFMLPSIDRLTASGKSAQRRSCRMLVLAPTRELAGQIAESARDYAKFAKMRIVTVFGGTSVNRNKQDLARGVDILIATPGRLVDLADQGALDLGSVEVLVLDEADQMLDLGFIHDLRRIVRLLPAQRQTLFFSATMPKAIKDLARQYLTVPVHVSVAPASTTAERVEQFVCFCNQPEKQALLGMVLRDGFAAGDMDRVLVFTRTKHGADRVVRKLGQIGIRANAIHGNKSQPQRERALGEFRDGKVRVLIATDIAARGIDISGVSHVINFELPNVSEQYVHRIGRTARAGRDGVAISFCAPDERDYLRDIQKLTRVTLDKVELPENFRAEVERVNARAQQGQDRIVREDDGDRQSRQPRRRGGGNRRAKPTAEAKPRGSSAAIRSGGNAGKQGGKPGGGNRRRRGGGGGRRSGAAQGQGSQG